MSDPIKAAAPAGVNPDPTKDGQPPVVVTDGQGDLPERAWMQDLPEPLRTSKTLRKFVDTTNLAKSYVEIESRFGRSVPIPKEGASSEEWGEFFSRIGRPGTFEEYDVPPDKLDKEFADSLRKKAHAAGLTKMQFKDTIDAIIERAESAQAGTKAVRERNRADVTAKLRAEYGKDYEVKMAKAEVAMGALFPDAIRAKLIDEGIKDDVEFMKSMVVYGEKFGNTQFVRGVPAASLEREDRYAWMDKYKH